jgi:asparagine synthase (glutamine-hydrolysing)
LDHDFVETCQKIPNRHKFLKGTPKHLIHKFLKGLLPLSLFQQPKEGFGMPVTDWMNQYKEPISELMENGALKKHLDWKTSPMEGLSEKHLNSKETEVVWKSLLLEIWLRIFVDGGQPQDIFPQYSSQK